MRETKLKRQLKRVFGDDEAEVRLARLLEWLDRDAAVPEHHRAAVECLRGLPALLDQVEGAYRHAARMMEISHHSIETSSADFVAVNGNLSLMNQSINSLVDSLGQGFFIFDRFGTCLPFYSGACLELIEGIPVGRQLGDVLKVPDRERYYFDGWVNLIFEGVMDFNEMAELGPKVFPHSAGRFVTLEFKPIRSSNDSLEGVAVIATDRSSEREATRQAEERQEFSEMVIKLTKERNQLFTFVQEARRMIRLVSEYSSTFTEGDGLREVRRLLHTIKGAASSFYIRRIKDCAHTFESELALLENGPGPVQDEVAARLEHYARELEAELNRFLAEHRELLGPNFEKLGHTRSVPLRELYSFAGELAQYPAGELLRRRFLESVVAVPISQLFQPFDSTVQQVATMTDRKLEPLLFKGEDVRVLQEVYEGFFNTLIHLFRNAVVHGIELPKERAVRGKNAAGRITVTVALLKAANAKASRATDWIEILVHDDGRGVDALVIRERLSASGRYPEPELKLESDEKVIQHVFDEGFSTSAAINEMSGRGIGLNVVREAVEQLDGEISVSSVTGQGTTFRILVPHSWSGLEKFAQT